MNSEIIKFYLEEILGKELTSYEESLFDDCGWLIEGTGSLIAPIIWWNAKNPNIIEIWRSDGSGFYFSRYKTLELADPNFNSDLLDAVRNLEWPKLTQA